MHENRRKINLYVLYTFDSKNKCVLFDEEYYLLHPA